MSARDHLHRLQVWQLAERRRYLADLESLAARLRADVERLRDEIGETGGDAKQAHSVFVRPLVDRRDKLLGSIAEIDVQIDEAREAVASAEQEVRLRGATIPPSVRSDLLVTRRARRAI